MACACFKEYGYVTKNARPPAKGRGSSKRIASLESRTQRLADAIRKHRSSTTARLDYLEGLFLDFLVYQNIKVSDLIEVSGVKEEST